MFKENDTTLKNNIKTNITRLRNAMEMTIRDFSKGLNIDENTYRVWEVPDKSLPKYDDIAKIAKACNVSIDFIYYNTEEFKDKDELLRVSADNDKYGKDIYGDSFFTELAAHEKILLMQIRSLNSKDQKEVIEIVAEKVKKRDNY